MSLAALEPKFFQNFCNAVGRPDLLAHQYAEAREDTEGFRALRDLFLSRTQAEWIDLFQTADACCEPVLPLHEVPGCEAFSNPDLFFRDAAGHLQLPLLPALPEGARTLSDAAALGEHSRVVLLEIGYTDDEVRRMEESGEIRCQ